MRPFRLLIVALATCLALLIPSVLVHADEGKDKGNKESSSPQAPKDTAPPQGPGSGSDQGGGSGPTGVSVPRVMLESVIANPQTVTAGSSFALTYTLVNQSKQTRVSNLKVTLSQADGAFLPVNGSSSTWISAIKPKGSVSRDVNFTTLPTLENRPYAITMTIEYEDASANSYTTTETISVPVAQPTRAETSTITVNPTEVPVGEETTVTFSFNNLGKSKIFNAKATVAEGQGVAAKEHFIGAVEPGASSNVEMTLMAAEERTEPITVVLSFEDGDGKATTLEKQLALTVLAGMQKEPMEPPLNPMEPEEPEPAQPQESGDAWLWWLIGGGVLAVVLLFASIAVARRAKRQQQQTSDLTLLDGDPLVAPDQP